MNLKRFGAVLIFILAFCGLADATYLTQNELNSTPLLCNIQNLSGCNIVTNSQYSRIFNVPVAELSLLFYGLIFIIAALEILALDSRLRRALQVLSLIGLVTSLYFTSLQIFVIKALCIYCLASTFTTLLIFIFATLIEPLRRKPRGPASSAEPLHLSMPPTT
ncbi:MAG: vitamin K epoxide reductase family protein [Minisyncoccia bacterium]